MMFSQLRTTRYAWSLCTLSPSPASPGNRHPTEKSVNFSLNGIQ